MNKILCRLLLPAILLTSGWAFAGQAGQASPFTGTWKLNVEKSKFGSGSGPKSETVTIAADRKVSVEGTGPDGSSVKWSYMPEEGKAVSIDGMEGETVMEKMSGNKVEHTWKHSKGTEMGRGVVSKDGKTMKYTLKGTNEQGQKTNQVMIFEKEGGSAMPSSQE